MTTTVTVFVNGPYQAKVTNETLNKKGVIEKAELGLVLPDSSVSFHIGINDDLRVVESLYVPPKDA